MKNLVIDIDGTLTVSDSNKHYKDVKPNLELINKIHEYKGMGFQIILFTARGMRTYSGDKHQITKYTRPAIEKWLQKHSIPYDELIIGKPWCGQDGFYVDNRSLRPSEFINMNYNEVLDTLE